jgi:hypothetical protein
MISEDEEEEVIPTCDICSQTQHGCFDVTGRDWNGETGNHISCEEWEARPQ